MINVEPLSVRSLNPAIPKDLETICARCLAKEPSRRYQTAGELADELGRFLRGEPIHARPVSRAVRVYRWRKPHPGFAGLSAAVLLLTATLAVGGPLAAPKSVYELTTLVEASYGAYELDTLQAAAKKAIEMDPMIGVVPAIRWIASRQLSPQEPTQLRDSISVRPPSFFREAPLQLLAGGSTGVAAWQPTPDSLVRINPAW